MPRTDSRAIRPVQPMNLPLTGGLWLSPSRVDAPLGTLTNCHNFEVVDGAYEESQGLTIVGPALDTGLRDFWHADLDPADCIITGSPVAGDSLFWYAEDGVTVEGTGRVYYWFDDASNVYITLDRITGVSPRRATSFYTNNGATLTFTGTGDTFQHAAQLGLTWTEYRGDRFGGALTASQEITANTWDAFLPDPCGVRGISGVFQLDDVVYAVRDFWGGKFTAGTNEPALGDKIGINGGTFTAQVAAVELTGGSWEEGDAEGVLFLRPTAATQLDMTAVSDWDAGATIENSTQANNVGVCLAAGNRQYQNKGLLWKRDYAGSAGWSFVDTGFSMQFKDGLIAPLAQLSPLLLTDSLESVTDTGYINLGSPATEYPATGTYSSWSGLGNMTGATPGTYATTTIAANDYSRVLEFDLANALPLIEGDIQILGIEVAITAHQTVGSDVVLNKVQLRDDTGGGEYLSDNRSSRQVLNTGVAATYTYGSQLDLWGYSNISQDNLNAGNLHLLVQFEATTSRTVNVDQVQVKIHYTQSGQEVYFYDGSADVASATLYSFQVHDGDWSTDDAQGYMTLRDITLTDAGAVHAGLQIRSASSGGGDLLATTASKPWYNLLPSLNEMDQAGTIYQSRRASFAGSEQDSSVFVVNGISQAFVVDPQGRFSFIFLPVDRDKDNPRYVEIHRNHLVLAVDSYMLVSSIGAPTNFSTFDGATTWSTSRDRITGLSQAPNGTLMVTCKDSIHLLTGSGSTGQDAFALRMLTDNSGARDYTITNLLGNMFVDYAGLTTADISDKYGGFDLGRKSNHVRPFIQQLLGTESVEPEVGNRLIGAIPVRKKNQYRIYMSNGDILTATLPESPDQPLSFTRQNYSAYTEADTRGYEATFAPTALDSVTRDNGEESILIGTRIGHVMRVDPDYMDILSFAEKSTALDERAETLVTFTPFKHLDLNPLRSPDPAQVTFFAQMDLFVEHMGYNELSRMHKTDYKRINHVPDVNAPLDTVGKRVKLGDYDNFTGRVETDYFSYYINSKTDGLSLRFSKFGGFGAVPLRLVTAVCHLEPKGPRVDSKHDTHRYEVVDAAIPNDLIIVGATAGITIAATTGEVSLDVIVAGATANVVIAGTQGAVLLSENTWTFDQDTLTFDETSPTWDGLDP